MPYIYQPARYSYVPRRRYSTLHLLFDVLMVFLTGGLWLIWILLRYLGRH